MGPTPIDGGFHHFNGGGFGAGGPAFAGPTLALAATSLFWLAGLTWLLWPWICSRLQARRRPDRPLEAAEPPSVELLRQRYVLGQIDAFAFEDMLNHLLVSQAREQEFNTREALMRGTQQDRHLRNTSEAPPMLYHSSGERMADADPATSRDDLEPQVCAQ